MAAYPTLTAVDLSGFSGRPAAAYTAYADTALAQALLLFRLATGLSDWPDESDPAQLARYAVLAMADAFVLRQPFQQMVVSPFSSETIGSYSYSKVLSLMMAGLPSGIFWFDLALQRLGISTDIGRVTSGSYSLFERDLQVEVTPEGVRRILGPADLNEVDTQFFISSQAPFDPSGIASGHH